MSSSLSMQSRWEVIQHLAPRYQQAPRAQKTCLLHECVSVTKASIPLKHQIPIRTSWGWDEAQPGFLEADLVAHCGMRIEGGYLYTLTLTDVATGWTECLPLLHRGTGAVRAALQRAQTLFPFPIRGLDTDNGVEFINEEVASYCEAEHITFTRGRSKQKRDQCFVEQKNRAVVRHMAGYERFTGEPAYRQLTELYRAVRLYVNCFQPSQIRTSQRSMHVIRTRFLATFEDQWQEEVIHRRSLG